MKIGVGRKTFGVDHDLNAPTVPKTKGEKTQHKPGRTPRARGFLKEKETTTNSGEKQVRPCGEIQVTLLCLRY